MAEQSAAGSGNKRPNRLIPILVVGIFLIGAGYLFQALTVRKAQRARSAVANVNSLMERGVAFCDKAKDTKNCKTEWHDLATACVQTTHVQDDFGRCLEGKLQQLNTKLK